MMPVRCRKLSAAMLVSAATRMPHRQPRAVARVFLWKPLTSSRLVLTMAVQVRKVQR